MLKVIIGMRLTDLGSVGLGLRLNSILKSGNVQLYLLRKLGIGKFILTFCNFFTSIGIVSPCDVCSLCARCGSFYDIDTTMDDQDKIGAMWLSSLVIYACFKDILSGW